MDTTGIEEEYYEDPDQRALVYFVTEHFGHPLSKDIRGIRSCKTLPVMA